MMHIADEKHTITQIKRILGKKISDLKDLKYINYNLIRNNDQLLIKIMRKGKEIFFSPEQIMALIIKKLIKDASDFMETPITKAVITVPAYFDFNQRSALEESAKLAGVEILGIINEPTAASLAYGLGTKENLSDSLALSIMKKDKVKCRKVLVLDLGGGTLDISVLTIENTNFDVKATLGDTHLGGIDFDNKLIDFCIKDFCQKMSFKENDVRKDLIALRRLRIQCEKGKKKLSKDESTIINVYNFYDGCDLYKEITRNIFNEECEDFYKKIEDILNKVLIESKFTNDEIDDVILVGGSTKMPKIREIIESKFNSNKIRDTINQDEAVVIGATWKAHKLAKKSKELNIFDITSSSLGVGSANKNKQEKQNGLLISVLIPKNSKFPIKSEVKKYTTIKDNQSLFRIKVYSGENKYVKDNNNLGEIIINNLPPGQAKTVDLFIFFEIDCNGILTVNAEVKSIGKKVSEKYSLYNNKVSNTIVILNKNPESKKKLDEIKNITIIIREKNNALKKIENDNDKINYLKELCDNCLKIINIYNLLRKNNDSENLFQKFFYYTQLLFKYYSQMIILDKEDKNSSEVINKIREEIPKFMNDNIENLIDAFDELKNKKPKKYIEIILIIVEILYKEGDRILDERKKNARYFSKKIYINAEKIKQNIDENLKKQMDFNLKQKFKEIETNYGGKVAQINAFTCLIKQQIKEKDSEYLPRKSNLTKVHKVLNNEEDIYLKVDIYQEMAESLSKVPSEEEAFCHANLIIINFKIFKNYDFNLYDKLNRRINFILDRLEEDDDIPEPEWHKKLMEVNEEIEKKKKEIEDKKK